MERKLLLDRIGGYVVGSRLVVILAYFLEFQLAKLRTKNEVSGGWKGPHIEFWCLNLVSRREGWSDGAIEVRVRAIMNYVNKMRLHVLRLAILFIPNSTI